MKLNNTYREFCLRCITDIQANIQKANPHEFENVNMYNVGLNLGYLESIIRNEHDLDNPVERGHALESVIDEDKMKWRHKS